MNQLQHKSSVIKSSKKRIANCVEFVEGIKNKLNILLCITESPNYSIRNISIHRFSNCP